MRPPIPDVAPPRARKASFEQPCTDPRNTVPATFFLSRSPTHDPNDDAEASPDSMYGVQSLDDTVHQATVAASECDSDIPAGNNNNTKLSPNPANDTLPPHDDGHHDEEDPEVEADRRRSALKAYELLNVQPPPSASASALSRPLTPLNLNFGNLDDPSSLPSSPKSLSSHSLKPLDDISITDEQSSQAVVSDEEDQNVPEPGTDSMPQLIMPSLRMPSRRPFTERGKAMGRLKLLVAGASGKLGSGKTSLIKSIVQECEDIVHVDPFPSSSAPRPHRSSRSRTATSEIYASTKPYPSWWSDLEDSRVLRRRKSMGDIVLERNLCFVDTPVSRVEQTDAIVHYMHQQLVRAIAAPNSSNVDFQNMLAGNGGSQVDVVIYLISQDTLTADIGCIKRLCDFSNVIPVISKSDLMSSDQVTALKSSFQKQAQAAGFKPFLFGNPSPGETGTLENQVPFAVSSAKANDDDIMDASTLMSPDYVQPLVASELSLLVQNLFDRDHLAWMRHSAGKKLVQRQHEPPVIQPLPQNTPPSLGSPTLSGLTNSNPSVSSSGFVSPHGDALDYTLARIADHTQREEKMAQVRLVKWAADLQQSLQNERERYAAMARGDRAIWLTERLSECVVDGSLVPITQSPGFSGLGMSPEQARVPNSREVEYRISRLSPHDPLGLVWWTDDLKERGWALFQIVGGFGMIGGLALCLARMWGLPSRGLSDWYLTCWGGD